MKRLYVSGLREGVKVEDVFLVISRSVSSTRGGSPYLKMKLADKTGEVDAVKWDATESEIARLQEDDYVLVHATVRSFNDSPQLNLDSFKRYGEPVDPADFLRSSTRDLGEMLAELDEIIGQISNPHLSALLRGLFADEDFAAKFSKAPAARSIHHGYISGLLEHTLGVARVCSNLAPLYPAVDRDMLITGAILHDVGKIEEFVWSASIRYSDAGNLVGHIVQGTMMVKQAAEMVEGFDPMLSLALQHMIISHHGTKEFGSPQEPKSLEAIMLHAADDLDAQMAICSQAIEQSDENGEKGMFTKRHFLLNRQLFKGIRAQTQVSLDGGSKGETIRDLIAVDSEYDPFAD